MIAACPCGASCAVEFRGFPEGDLASQVSARGGSEVERESDRERERERERERLQAENMRALRKTHLYLTHRHAPYDLTLMIVM